MTCLVYIGPTLPVAEVTRRLPGAIVCPPAAVGDILAATRRRGVRRIAIIDGYFERMAAVWHKEILIAIERGIEVWGAASMGALRAAELAPFGMIGVGTIYRDYARGAVASETETAPAAITARGAGATLPPLVADDEVAVAHLPAEYGYRATSDALVNLRDGLARATRASIITARTRDRLIELARARFYRERSWAQLVADGTDVGLPRRQLEALARWPKPDRKAADATLLLARLARMRPRSPKPLRVPRTWALRQLASLK